MTLRLFPANWVKLQLGTWKVHGSKGEDDLAVVTRSMKPGEHFIEYMRMPDRFDFVGDWEVLTAERPNRWGFISRSWHGLNMPTIIEVEYTFEKVDDNHTRWSRHRINTVRDGCESKADFLADKNDLEDEYQQVTKAYLEQGKPKEPSHNPVAPHPPGWLDTLPVYKC